MQPNQQCLPAIFQDNPSKLVPERHHAGSAGGRMTEVVVTTRDIRHVQSSSQIVTINMPTLNSIQAGCLSFRNKALRQ